jgi:hypothetical protein
VLLLLLQAVPTPPSGIDPFIWLVWVAVTGAISKLYWDSRQESKRKDAQIDKKDELIVRLSEQVGRLAGATDKLGDIAERRGRERETPR